MENETPILVKSDNIVLGEKPFSVDDPIFQRLSQNIQYTHNNYTPPKIPDFEIKNPHKKSEDLLKQVVDNQEEQSSTLHFIRYEDTKTNSQLKVLLEMIDKQNCDIENLQNINKELTKTNKTLEENNKHSLRNGILLGLIPLGVEWIAKIIIYLLQYLEVIPK